MHSGTVVKQALSARVRRPDPAQLHPLKVVSLGISHVVEEEGGQRVYGFRYLKHPKAYMVCMHQGDIDVINYMYVTKYLTKTEAKFLTVTKSSLMNLF